MAIAEDSGVSSSGLASRFEARVGLKRGYLRKLGMLMSGTVGAQAIGVLSMLALARLYAPADFGVYAFFFVIAGLLAGVSTGAYDEAGVLATSPQEAAEIALLAVAFSVATAALLLASTPAIEALLGQWEATRPLTGQVFLLAVAVASGGSMRAFVTFHIQGQRFFAVAASRFAGALSAAAIGIGLGFMNAGGEGLILGFVFGQIIAIGVLIFYALPAMRGARAMSLIRHARSQSSFPRYMILSYLSYYLGSNMVSFITPAYFGVGTLGQYNLGQRVTTLPMGIIGFALGDVFRTNMSAQNASKAEVAYIFKSTALQLSLAGLVLICPIILAGPFLFSIFFGPQWEKAGLFAQILAPSVFASFVAMPLCPVLLRAAMQRTNMALQMLFPISAIAALLLCMRSGASFEDFLAIVSASYTAISGVVLAACYRALRYVR